MSAKASPTSFSRIRESLKDGDEPTELLLALVSSPLVTLLARNVAYVVTGNDSETSEEVLAVIFTGCRWDESVGIMLRDGLPTLANTNGGAV